MTQAEKLQLLKAMVGESDTEEVLLTYLNIAGHKTNVIKRHISVSFSFFHRITVLLYPVTSPTFPTAHKSFYPHLQQYHSLRTGTSSPWNLC